MAAVSVVIVEDHPEFRDALYAAVRNCPDMELLPVFKDLPAAMSLLEQVCPHVLLVDLGLPSGSGLQQFHLVHAKARGCWLCPSRADCHGQRRALADRHRRRGQRVPVQVRPGGGWCHTSHLLAAGHPVCAGLRKGAWHPVSRDRGGFAALSTVFTLPV